MHVNHTAIFMAKNISKREQMRKDGKLWFAYGM